MSSATARVGRSGATKGPVLLDSRSVSRLHALIQREDAGDQEQVDLGSCNGSFSTAGASMCGRSLRDGDHRVTAGDPELAFRGGVNQNRLATILAVDIRDFTPLARAVSESLLSQTVGTRFLRAGQIAQRDGTPGAEAHRDAVMAVWVHDDPGRAPADVRVALEAAFEIAAATAEISAVLPAPLRIGAGMNTGLVVLGEADYTAMGDAVNTAFRLEAATKALDAVLAPGAATYRELGLSGPAPFVPREVALKGYDDPTTAWSVSFDELRAFLDAGPR